MVKMLQLLCLCLLLATVAANYNLDSDYRQQFQLFKQNYGKIYSDPNEEDFHMQIFSENLEKITEHNKLYEQGLVTFQMGINEFTDMLRDEISLMLNRHKSSTGPSTDGSTFLRPHFLVEPDELDWRTKGYVTPVKKQRQCGSCWAFSSTGSLEGQHFRKTGKLVSLSEQNLVDCSHKYGNNGCGGGFMNNSYRYIKANGGIDTEESYPYEAKDKKCRFNPSTIGATVTGYTNINRGNESDLLAAVASVGPIAVSIHCTLEFCNYHSGVFYHKHCSTRRKDLDHAVLVVGYGTDPVGGDYWLVKNSWGARWGDHGYIKMARNRNNNCGIATDALYPHV